MRLKLVTLIFAIYILCVVPDSAAENYARECLTWTDEIKRIVSEPRVNVTCGVNEACSGIDCKGLYVYEGYLTSGKYEKNICFGLWMNPCSQPTELTVYIEQISDKISFIHTVKANPDSTHDETEIPGAEESLDLPGMDGVARITVTLVTDFQSKVVDGRNYVILGMQLKPKVTVLDGFASRYPDDLKVWLVKDVEVPVPPCDRKVSLPTHTPNTCPNISQVNEPDFKPGTPRDMKVVHVSNNYVVCEWTPAPGVKAQYFTVVYYKIGKEVDKLEKRFKSSTVVIEGLEKNSNYTFYVKANNEAGTSRISNTVTVTTLTDATTSGRLFLACDPNTPVLKACDSNQLCNPDTKKCMCIPGLFRLDPITITCVQVEPTTTGPLVILTDSFIEDSSTGSKMKQSVTAAAVGSVVAVCVVAVVAGLVFLYYRKKRARYAEHTLLRNQEEERAADDGDVAPITP